MSAYFLALLSVFLALPLSAQVDMRRANGNIPGNLTFTNGSSTIAANGTLVITTAPTAALAMPNLTLSGANVGIGSASPDVKLLLSSGVFKIDGSNAGISIGGAPITSSATFKVLDGSADNVALFISSGGTLGPVVQNMADDDTSSYLVYSATQTEVAEFGWRGGAMTNGSAVMMASRKNDPLYFLTNASSNNIPKMVVLAGGNVGIGAISPDVKLLLSSGVFKVDGSNAAISIGGAPITSTATFKNSVFIGTGTVLAGTYAPLTVSSNEGNALAYQLELNNLSGVGNGSTASGILFGVATDATGYRKGGIAWVRQGGNGIGDLLFLNDATADGSNAALNDAKLAILTNGNVAIGQAHSGSGLSVAGTSYFASSVTVNADTKVTGSGTGGGIFVQGTSPKVLVHNGSTAVLQIQAASTAGHGLTGSAINDAMLYNSQNASIRFGTNGDNTRVVIGSGTITTGSALCLNANKVLTTCSGLVGADGTCTCPQ